MSDISLAVGDGASRTTYAELAETRGISLPSARRLVLRHHWPRQAGNDGIVRVTVPLIALVNGPETEGFSVTTTDPTTSHATDTVARPAVATTDPLSDPVTVTLSLAVDSLREQLAIANDPADRRIDKLLEERRAERQQEADERRRLLALLTDWRPWWKRWLR